jgi:DNA-binding NtrC family response regulator
MATSPGSAATVVLVDDESSIRELLSQHLSEFNVLPFGSGEEAVEWIQGHADQPVDVAIADYKMLGMNGVKTLQAIRRLKPSAKLVLMSGVIVGDMGQFAAQNSFHGVLAKPFVCTEVADLVEHLARGRSAL